MSIVLPLPPQGGQTLSGYVYLLRRLLHDPMGRMYPTADLITYINISRKDLARRSACLRVMQEAIVLPQNVDTYDAATTLPFGPYVADVLGIAVFWGNLKYQLRAQPFQRLDTWLRTWNTYLSQPTDFARYGGTKVIIAPIPNQDYTSNWDTAVIPTDLTSDADVEVIPTQFQEPIPFYAAYYAKMYEQSFGESELFKARYLQILSVAMATWRRRMFSNPYGAP